MKEYDVTFTAHHLISVEAENEEEAREKAINLFNGFANWETTIEETQD